MSRNLIIEDFRFPTTLLNGYMKLSLACRRSVGRSLAVGCVELMGVELEEKRVRSFIIAFFCDFAYIKINLIGQLCRGFAAGGAGGFCN